MALLVNLQDLEDRDVRFDGELPVESMDLDIRDDVAVPAQTLTYDLAAQLLQDALLIRGKIQLDVNCQCVRCMTEFTHVIEFADWICHVPVSGEEKAPIIKGCVDLTPYIREDILLAFPQHPLCREDCPGLQPKDSNKSQEDPSDHDDSSSPWDQLNQLKL